MPGPAAKRRKDQYPPVAGGQVGVLAVSTVCALTAVLSTRCSGQFWRGSWDATVARHRACAASSDDAPSKSADAPMRRRMSSGLDEAAMTAPGAGHAIDRPRRRRSGKDVGKQPARGCTGDLGCGCCPGRSAAAEDECPCESCLGREVTG